ncbi:MAG: trimethylamine methyltransferase [Gammaproteobacteria bacterium]|nr:trimethylamine methyltransferase [Gammaproteobacteria bacterium]
MDNARVPRVNHTKQRSIHFHSLTEEQLQKLHDASLEIMHRTGMRFYDDTALALFKKAGAKISEDNLVQIPPKLVEWAIKTAPKDIPIYDQNGRQTMSLGGDRSYFGVGSDCMHIYDLDSGKRRKAVLDDVINGVRLVDALPDLDFVMSMFLPSDVPEDIYERKQMSVMLQESSKPIVFVGIEENSTVYAIQMAALVAGGLEELQRRPFVINYVNTVSSLKHNQESVARMLYAAERNIPTIYAPGNSRGVTSPMTMAGTLALGNAGQLGGLVLSQIMREGSPFLRSNPGGFSMDMRSMVSLYSAPDVGPYGWDLTNYYGIPTFGAAGCSDSKIFDGQAAAEAALTLFENAVNGVNLIHDVGYLDCAMTGSLELASFCADIIGWLRQYLKEFEINDETLALDLIHDIGPDGHFLESEHTLRYVRDAWAPKMMDRLDYHRWENLGATTLQQRANFQVKEIISHHRAEPLARKIVDQLEEIVYHQ